MPGPCSLRFRPGIAVIGFLMFLREYEVRMRPSILLFISFSAFSYVLLYDSTCRIQFSRLPAMAVRSFVRSIELLNAELLPDRYRLVPRSQVIPYYTVTTRMMFALRWAATKSVLMCRWFWGAKSTRMISALRWAAMRSILMCHWFWGAKSQNGYTVFPQVT